MIHITVVRVSTRSAARVARIYGVVEPIPAVVTQPDPALHVPTLQPRVDLSRRSKIVRYHDVNGRQAGVELRLHHQDQDRHHQDHHRQRSLATPHPMANAKHL
eukprot:COSAG02_NODE_10227_length_1991_cov_2.487315_2_plen_103_part_00